MILNASHEITLSGLPSDVLDAYVRYKKGTRAIISWIVQYGPSGYAGVKSLPLKELARLAAAVTGVLKEVPDVIHFHFRETIAARKRLSKYFRGNVDDTQDASDTVNHEHFTDSLTKIYTDLCACCDKPKLGCTSNRSSSEQIGTTYQLKNHYENLPIEDNLNEVGPESFDSCQQCSSAALPSCLEATVDGGLIDDEIGNSIELAKICQDMYTHFSFIEKCWAKAGRGNVHFVAAAFVTNLVFSKLEQLDKQMRELDEHITLGQLRHNCQLLVHRDSGQAKPQWLDLLDRLNEVKQSYEHYTKGHPLSTISSCPSCIQKPSDYAQSMSRADASPRSSILRVLVDNIMHLVFTRTAPCAVIRNSSPVYADLGYVLSDNTDEAHETRLQMALQALNVSYCKYLDNSIPSQVSLCRLKALRLAQEAIKSIGNIIDDKTCFPCACTQTLAYHLRSLETDLNGFVKHKCWDLYFQSPWVAGNHILETLDLCHYYGMKLFVYRHYIGAVVHSYNILQQLAGLERLPLLEHICEQHKDTFFPGGQRPTSNFRACWSRYVGARLKFKKGHKSRDHRDSWCMAVPTHAARKAAGLGVCGDAKDEKNGCLLFKIKQQDYHLTEEQRQVLLDEGVCEQLENMVLGQGAPEGMTESDSSQHQLTAVLPGIRKYLTSTGSDAPTALLDHFAVFKSCVSIVSDLSDASHTDEKEKGMNCICFASAILGGADRIVEARRLGKITGSCWKKEEREGVLDLAMKAIRQKMGGREVREWCWEI